MLVLADDLTGAADAAVAFAPEAVVVTFPACVDAEQLRGVADKPVLSIDTATRALDADAAGARMTAVVQSLAVAGLLSRRPIFVKVDSLLRGPVRECLASLVGAWPGRPTAVCAPALPAQRRTTVAGIQLDDGVPVNVAAAQDPVAPPVTSALAEIVRGLEADVSVRDAVDDADLDFLAHELAKKWPDFIIGSSGLAHALARLPRHRGSGSGSGGAGSGPLAHRARGQDHVLAATVSRHPATRAQLDHLGGRTDVVVLRPRPDGSARWWERVLVDAAAALARGHVVVAAEADLAADPTAAARTGRELLSGVAAVLDGLLDVPAVAGSNVIILGGDLAAACCRTSAMAVLALLGEPAAGAAACRVSGGPRDGTHLVLRSGGFGSPHALDDLFPLLD